MTISNFAQALATFVLKGLRFITGRKSPVFLGTKKTVEMNSSSQGDTSVTAPLEISFLISDQSSFHFSKFRKLRQIYLQGFFQTQGDNLRQFVRSMDH